MRLVAVSLLFAPLLLAQQAPRPVADTVVSPEVRPDSSVTFRIYAPKAAAVQLRGEFLRSPQAVDLTKSDDGIWSVTTSPIAPDLYWYHFVVDGVKTLDTRNPLLKTGARGNDSAVDVPGPAAAFQALQDVPHGAVHIEWYKSSVTGRLRRLHIYTPPGYASAKRKYPVLYLLHGSGDTDREWTSYGRSNWIADNLLAAGRIKPLIIVMTDGHIADMADPAQRARNTSMYADDLTGSVIPFVESKYRTEANREHRALAGLSMGGGQTLNGGLKHLDKFAWLGVYSMGIRPTFGDFEKEHDAVLADAAGTNKKLKLFWIACGKDDFLFEAATNLHNTLEKRGIKHTWTVTEGAHTWPVWRQYLNTFLPLIFTN